jgi:hypothetical protein
MKAACGSGIVVKRAEARLLNSQEIHLHNVNSYGGFETRSIEYSFSCRPT